MDIIVRNENCVHKLIFPGTEQELIDLWTSQQKVKLPTGHLHDFCIDIVDIGSLLSSSDRENIRELGYGDVEFFDRDLHALYWWFCYPFPGAGVPHQDEILDEFHALGLEIPRYFIEMEYTEEGEDYCLYIVDINQRIYTDGTTSGLPKLLQITDVQASPDGTYTICVED